MNLTRRLLASYLAIVALTAAVLIVAADRLLRDRLIDEAKVELECEARYLASAATGLRGGTLDSLVHHLGAATGHRLTVMDRSGLVIADSDFPHDQLSTLENHAARPEMHEALAGRTGYDLRTSVSTGRVELKVAVPYAGGVARISSPLPQVDAVIGHAQGAVLLGSAFAVAIAGLLAFGFARGVARPLTVLKDGAAAIARGEHPALDTRGRDEVGQLARALRAVDENLSSRLAELERERSGMAALIGSMVEGMVACNARGDVTAVNPAARDLLGLAPGDEPPPVQELFRHKSAREAIEATLAGATTTDLEVDIDEHVVLLSGRALKEGGAVFVMHDLTHLKRLETIRRDFVANVSHELKTPLTVVHGYAETLRKDEPPADVRAGFLDTMLANTERMQRLIDDLLDLSRIESRTWTPQRERVAIGPLARDVWASLGGRGHAAQLAFEVALGARAEAVHADPEAMRQILTNVLDNAARYTPAGGRVRVETAREDGLVRVDIRDTGPGIPGEHLPRVFERFYRVDPARSRELGGTGLGLAIVKHLVEAHGGRVEALSTLGAGTTIRVHLPAGAP
ncbi:MAG: ATP-binding protein [Gemmatimonadales bacterium]